MKKEKLELSSIEKVFCKVIRDKESACITRNYPEHGKGALRLWQHPPIKDMKTAQWLGYKGEKGVYLENNLFPFITWENGTWNISNMLNNLEFTVEIKSKFSFARGERDDRFEEVRKKMYEKYSIPYRKDYW